ncbi:hypothetical protein J6590_065473 [Homalodisca vitripennis]|nr:hypothetical protein J6590_065473 [Homalodisca vitripennis]
MKPIIGYFTTGSFRRSPEWTDTVRTRDYFDPCLPPRCHKPPTHARKCLIEQINNDAADYRPPHYPCPESRASHWIPAGPSTMYSIHHAILRVSNTSRSTMRLVTTRHRTIYVPSLGRRTGYLQDLVQCIAFTMPFSDIQHLSINNEAGYYPPPHYPCPESRASHWIPAGPSTMYSIHHAILRHSPCHSPSIQHLSINNEAGYYPPPHYPCPESRTSHWIPAGPSTMYSIHHAILRVSNTSRSTMRLVTTRHRTIHVPSLGRRTGYLQDLVQCIAFTMPFSESSLPNINTSSSGAATLRGGEGDTILPELYILECA